MLAMPVLSLLSGTKAKYFRDPPRASKKPSGTQGSFIGVTLSKYHCYYYCLIKQEVS